MRSQAFTCGRLLYKEVELSNCAPLADKFLISVYSDHNTDEIPQKKLFCVECYNRAEIQLN